MKGLENYSHIRWGEIYDEAKKISDFDFNLYRNIGVLCLSAAFILFLIPFFLKTFFNNNENLTEYYWMGAFVLAVGSVGIWHIYSLRKNLIRVVQGKIVVKEIWKEKSIKSGEPRFLYRFRIHNEYVAPLYPDGIYKEIAVVLNELDTPNQCAISLSPEAYKSFNAGDSLIYLLSPQNDMMAFVPKNPSLSKEPSKNQYIPFVFLSEDVELSNGERVFITKTISLDSDEKVIEHELIEQLGEEKK